MVNSTDYHPARPISARGSALDLISAVLRRRRPLDDAIDDSTDLASLSVRDRAFARLLVATVLRRLGQIDALIAHCLATPLPPRAVSVHDMLRLGIAQLLFLRTPAHAAVATTVDLAQARGFVSHKGLVNAVLRRLTVDGPDLVGSQDAAFLNTPAWLWRAWTAQFGEATTRRIAESHASEAPLDISVSRDPDFWADRLQARILPTGTLRRPAGGAIANLPGFQDGAWWVQDAAAALPAKLFGDLRDRFVIDLCAAPGGKTAQLANAGADILAVDRSARRIERMAGNLHRLGLKVRSETADAVTWRPERPADAVLLDAPCSSTGTIRRHPDVPHLKGPEDVARLALVQERLLHAALDMLKPGGTLIYCTCSLEPEEGIDQVASLFASGAPVERQTITADEVGGLSEILTSDGDIRSLPCHLAAEDGIDGFYAARLKKHAG